MHEGVLDMGSINCGMSCIIARVEDLLCHHNTCMCLDALSCSLHHT